MVTMALFLSTYINKLDSKGRVSVPATFRSSLASSSFQGIVAFKSKSHIALECFGMDDMIEISKRLDHFDLFSEAQDDLATVIFAESKQLPFDGDGRIVLPEELRSFCNMTDKVAFVGMGQKFQIWEPEALEKRLANARDNVREQNLTIPASKD